MSRTLEKEQGFTLIEVLVSMLLLAVMSILAWQAVDVIFRLDARHRGDMTDSLHLQQFWAQVGQDLFHLRARPYVDGLGGMEGAYVVGQDKRRLSFTRGGLSVSEDNPSGLLRVDYLLSPDGVLQRQARPLFVGRQSQQVDTMTLLTQVDGLGVEQMNRSFIYEPNWPPLNDERPLDSVPVMIRLTLVTEAGESSRLFPGLDATHRRVPVIDEEALP